MPYSQGATRHRGDIAAAVMESEGWETGLIGSRVLPTITTEDETGEYPKFKLATGNLLKREANILRAPRAASARGDFGYEWDTYSTKEYSFEMPVGRVDKIKASRYFDAEVIAARLAKRKLLLEREIMAAATTFSTANYGNATNSGTAYTIAQIANFDVGLDIDAIKEVLNGKGESDTDLSVVMSNQVFTRLRASTKLQNRLRGIGVSSDTILNVDTTAVAEALGVKEVIVGKNYYDTAAEGVAYSGSAIWGNTYIWVGRLGSSGNVTSMLSGAAQYNIIWNKFGGEFSVFEYEEPQIKSMVLGVEEYRTTSGQIVNANAGALLATQYS
jgi:hypothetical protein